MQIKLFHILFTGDTIGSFIAKHLQLFPPWLKIIITVRADKINTATRGLPFHHIRYAVRYGKPLFIVLKNLKDLTKHQ